MNTQFKLNVLETNPNPFSKGRCQMMNPMFQKLSGLFTANLYNYFIDCGNANGFAAVDFFNNNYCGRAINPLKMEDCLPPDNQTYIKEQLLAKQVQNKTANVTITNSTLNSNKTTTTNANTTQISIISYPTEPDSCCYLNYNIKNSIAGRMCIFANSSYYKNTIASFLFSGIDISADVTCKNTMNNTLITKSVIDQNNGKYYVINYIITLLILYLCIN